MTNRLIHELSPYLLQHAHNPVDWRPWGEEAFAVAVAEDKPVLLSIGYSACHWCHVMERESFEDPGTAALMNDLFVSIKVDREERPDLDGIYMTAVQGLTGRGGWPMTVFLTPDRKPFYGGTYYPPEDRGASPGFKRVLLTISEAYANRRAEVVGQADTICEYIRSQSSNAAPLEHLDSTILEGAARTLIQQFDAVHGGFGGAPKFPQAMALDFLLRFHHRTGNTEARTVVEYTLRKMANGGIYDQIGGGFHRYSVDDRWLIPHFEKMLYDNALLARTYLHAYQATLFPPYRKIVEEILDYALREMQDPLGGFYSAQDADSEGEEGKYYTWSRQDIQEVVGAPLAEHVCQYFGVSDPGPVEGKSTLTQPSDPAAVALNAHLNGSELEAMIHAAGSALLAARERRIPPATDDKVLTSWNGLMLKSLAEAAAVLGNERYEQAATRCAAFLTERLWKDGRVHRVFRGEASLTGGFLEDYAALADGLLALYATTFDPGWFEIARSIADAMLSMFWDADEQTLRDTSHEAEQLVTRPKDHWDNATPSGTSLACGVLVQLWAYTGEPRYEEVARKELARIAGLMAQSPVGFGHLLSVLDMYLGPLDEIAIAGQLNDPRTQALLKVVRGAYLPSTVVAVAPPVAPGSHETIPLLANRTLIDNAPAAYVCRQFVCDLPVTTPEALASLLPIRAVGVAE